MKREFHSPVSSYFAKTKTKIKEQTKRREKLQKAQMKPHLIFANILTLYYTKRNKKIVKEVGLNKNLEGTRLNGLMKWVY